MFSFYKHCLFSGNPLTGPDYNGIIQTRKGITVPKTKPAKLAYVRQWQIDNRERYLLTKRRSVFRRRYGVEPEYYDTALEAQGGVCAICKRPPPPNKPLCVDHDHETNRVRGLLCTRCNLVLGNIESIPDALVVISNYLSVSTPVVGA